MEIKKYKFFLESKSGKLYRYGCVIETDYKYNFNQVKKIIYSKANGQKLEITLE